MQGFGGIALCGKNIANPVLGHGEIELQSPYVGIRCGHVFKDGQDGGIGPERFGKPALAHQRITDLDAGERKVARIVRIVGLFQVERAEKLEGLLAPHFAVLPSAW